MPTFEINFEGKYKVVAATKEQAMEHFKKEIKTNLAIPYVEYNVVDSEAKETPKN